MDESENNSLVPVSEEVSTIQCLSENTRTSYQPIKSSAQNFLEKRKKLQKLIRIIPKNHMIQNVDSQANFKNFLNHLFEVDNLFVAFTNLAYQTNSSFSDIVNVIQLLIPLCQEILSDEKRRFSPHFFSSEATRLKGIIAEIDTLIQGFEKLFGQVITAEGNISANIVRASIVSKENIDQINQNNFEPNEKQIQDLEVVKVTEAIRDLEKSILDHTYKKKLSEEEITQCQEFEKQIQTDLENHEKETKEAEQKFMEECTKLKNGISVEDYNERVKSLQLEYDQKCESSKQNHDRKVASIQEKIENYQKDLSCPDVHISKDMFHFILVIDESGSMKSYWESVIGCFKDFLNIRKASSDKDVYSVLLFDDKVRRLRTTLSVKKAIDLPKLPNGGGTNFLKPVLEIKELLELNPDNAIPVVVFFTDGDGEDNGVEAVLTKIRATYGKIQFKFFAIGFGFGPNQEKLKKMSMSANGGLFFTIGNSKIEYIYNATRIDELRDVFNTIASVIDNQRVVAVFNTVKYLREQISEEGRLLEQMCSSHKEMLDKSLSHLVEIKNKGLKTPSSIQEGRQKIVNIYSPKKDALNHLLTKTKENIIKHTETMNSMIPLLKEFEKKLADKHLDEEMLKKAQEKKRKMLETQLNQNNEQMVINFEMTGWSKQQDYEDFDNLFPARAEALDALKTIIQINKSFVKQLRSNIDSLFTLITGKRLVGSSLTNQLEDIFNHFRTKFSSNEAIKNISVESAKQSINCICENFDPNTYKEVSPTLHQFEFASVVEKIIGCSNRDEYETVISETGWISDREKAIEEKTQELSDVNEKITEKNNELLSAESEEKVTLKEEIRCLKESKVVIQKEITELKKNASSGPIIRCMVMINGCLKRVNDDLIAGYFKKVASTQLETSQSILIPLAKEFDSDVKLICG